MTETTTPIHVSGTVRPDSGPWNPGIESHLRRQLLPLSTIFRPENVFTSLEQAEELRDLTGLGLDELIVFRPQRLVLHELLIRVTADFSVPNGPRIEDLGINFRRMTETILARYLEPRASTVAATYEALRRQFSAVIDAELAATLPSPAARRPSTAAGHKRGLLGLLRRARPVQPAWAYAEADTDWGARLLAGWDAKARSSDDDLSRAACRALVKLMSALFKRHGRLWGERDLIASLAVDIACNDYGSEEIGRLIAPYLIEAARCEGYRLLPAQQRPIVMNTKGASASGKSTMRPLQKTLADRIGVRWSDFALISPDIWRKQLLDYSSLGTAHRYAGTFTGHELGIIDQKLDRYMARKAEREGMSHLLIDRFRFDSFAPDSDEAGSNLLTRFGDIVYLFFMITPPDATVERSWKRGLEVGRFKAVDDLLAHNVEAYSGMPQLFFTWARRAGKRVHYEFLDNSVPPGERPRTVAFGWNGEMNVLDVKCMLDVERYRRVDVNATSPEGLYRGEEAVAPEKDTRFLVQCARRLPVLNFADRESGRIYLRMVSGAPVWADPEALRKALARPETRVGILAAAPDVLDGSIPAVEQPTYLRELLGAERIHTLGRWGDAG